MRPPLSPVRSLPGWALDSTESGIGPGSRFEPRRSQVLPGARPHRFSPWAPRASPEPRKIAGATQGLGLLLPIRERGAGGPGHIDGSAGRRCPSCREREGPWDKAPQSFRAFRGSLPSHESGESQQFEEGKVE
ncbi:MAG: hypothetical protein CBC48_16225 [bacterium TMED88]|nr:MAG: hypothetical protein CBC48_16225 [bacterium TMED88]